ncbi:MAG: DUF2178 domain-containing protein [Candidatus Koribacter versatilis]|nr:DUF2178 domain-containing protein [Candidatus Koribacter versatilis]
MAEQEKRAWFMLTIVVATLVAYFAFISFVRFDSVSLTVFALIGFLGLRRSKRSRDGITYDERDREIEKKALLWSLGVFYALILVFSLAVGFTNGWDRSVSLWTVIQVFWAVSLVIWAIKAAFIIVLYRRGAHA